MEKRKHNVFYFSIYVRLKNNNSKDSVKKLTKVLKTTLEDTIFE